MAVERRRGAGWSIHPREILSLEFLKPMNVSGYRLAKAIGVNCQTVNDIVLRKRGISAYMALRLGKFFGTTSEFWMNLQSAYELAQAKTAVGNQVDKIRPHHEAA